MYRQTGYSIYHCLCARDQVKKTCRKFIHFAFNYITLTIYLFVSVQKQGSTEAWKIHFEFYMLQLLTIFTFHTEK